MASVAAMLGCPSTVLADEAQPVVVVAGEASLHLAVELERVQSCDAAVGDCVDHRGCCLGGEAFALVGDQAGDGQGVTAEVDGAGGAGLPGGGDDAGDRWVGVGAVFGGGVGDVPVVEGEGLVRLGAGWLCDRRGSGVDCSVVGVNGAVRFASGDGLGLAHGAQLSLCAGPDIVRAVVAAEVDRDVCTVEMPGQGDAEWYLATVGLLMGGGQELGSLVHAGFILETGVDLCDRTRGGVGVSAGDLR